MVQAGLLVLVVLPVEMVSVVPLVKQELMGLVVSAERREFQEPMALQVPAGLLVILVHQVHQAKQEHRVHLELMEIS